MIARRSITVGLLADAVLQQGGIGRYTRELLQGLGRRDDVSLVVVAPVEAEATVRSLANGAVRDLVPIGGIGQIGRALWERFLLGRQLENLGVDVVHGTKHMVPRTRLPTVLTTHDVMAITWPSQFNVAKRVLLPRQYRASMKRATALIAVSATVAARVAELEPSVASRIVVVPLAIPDALLRASPTVVPHVADTSFALYVGDLSPRKNVGFLLGLWPRVYARTRLALVVVGDGGVHSSRVGARLNALERDGQALWLRSVSDGELRWLYEHTQVALCPSLEEGYGLPVAEALSLGAPVIAGTDAALVETGDGRAAHVDPTDDEAWTRAIVAVETRQRVSAARPRTTGNDEWDVNVATTVDVYRRVREGAAISG